MASPSLKPEPQPETRGGAREGAGRPPLPKRQRLRRPAYVALNDAESREIKKRAKEAELTVSMYLRRVLGFPTTSDD